LQNNGSVEHLSELNSHPKDNLWELIYKARPLFKRAPDHEVITVLTQSQCSNYLRKLEQDKDAMDVLTLV